MRKNVSSGYRYEESFGYSRAVRVGDIVLVSGTTARPPQLDGDAEEQLRGAIELVAEGLAEAGARLEDVVRTVVYLRRAEDVEAVTRAHVAAFGAIRPANTLIHVAGLFPAQALVEIEVTAVVDDRE